MDADNFSNDQADARRIRINDGASIDSASQDPPRNAPGSPAFVGKTVIVTTYPTGAARFFGVKPTAVTGTESEGSTATFSTRTPIVYALNLGTAIPPSGTYVICTFVPRRWVFRYDG